MPKTAYQVLGVSNTATDKEIRDRFHDFAREMHPDTSPEQEEESTRAWWAAKDAYELLRNPTRRAAYDKELALLMGPCKDCKGTGQHQKMQGFRVERPRPCGTCNGTGKAVP